MGSKLYLFFLLIISQMAYGYEYCDLKKNEHVEGPVLYVSMISGSVSLGVFSEIFSGSDKLYSEHEVKERWKTFNDGVSRRFIVLKVLEGDGLLLGTVIDALPEDKSFDWASIGNDYIARFQKTKSRYIYHRCQMVNVTQVEYERLQEYLDLEFEDLILLLKNKPREIIYER